MVVPFISLCGLGKRLKNLDRLFHMRMNYNIYRDAIFERSRVMIPVAVAQQTAVK